MAKNYSLANQKACKKYNCSYIIKNAAFHCHLMKQSYDF